MGDVIYLTTMESESMLPVDVNLNSPTVQQAKMCVGADQQMMHIYLRIKPFSKEELSDHEDQECVLIVDGHTVMLSAPKGSATMKSSEKGVCMSIHKFYFSKVFGPQTSQAELFEDTVESQVSDFLNGRNSLIFSYGVTNAGKTFTIQGTGKEPGILPRVLDATFRHAEGRLYEGMNLKPYLRNEAQLLHPDQVKKERIAKASLFASVKDECDRSTPSSVSESPVSSDSNLSSFNLSHNSTVPPSSPAEEGGRLFALWVAFFEIYNECVYDLLQPSTSKKRSSLRVCDDGAGNAHVKNLQWINVQSLSEAYKLLQLGNRNRSAAATKINQSSSRSHSIFTLKLLKIDGQMVERISEFSVCDLAGSERCHKAKTFGERLKEAGSINGSLLILGKCITALRNNQADGTKSTCIPFRESKLTKLFQTFFCGKGKASMIVNINQCASTYDETLHVMKFSAIAKQVVQVIPDKTEESLSPCLFGRDGKPLVRKGVIDSKALESYLSEEELLDEEADMSLLPQSELLNMIEGLRTKLLAERRRKLVQEIEIRKEMGDAMLQQILESEELRAQQIEELKESYAEKLENTFEMYKDAIKEHAYQCAMNNLEDNYVPLDEFTAEQEKVESLGHKVSELESLLSRGGAPVPPKQEQSSQTEASNGTEDADGWFYKEKYDLERMCKDKQLISSLEKRLMEVGETLQVVQDAFVEKSALLEALQKTADDQSRALEKVLQQNDEKDKEIASLKDQLCKLSQKSPVKKTKRGLFANFKDAVASPRIHPTGRNIRLAGSPKP
ncbi:kinesin-like protein KIF20A [Nothobranchius furzeri]|uniref:Kinesin-like protein n=1 Tax=Nothobranchius furzeri TaxID=105023 RepID=A0A8C6MG20_NOTFU|nr:kinesin-like protein KIF20A [Nothobranchius furzeri]